MFLHWRRKSHFLRVTSCWGHMTSRIVHVLSRKPVSATPPIIIANIPQKIESNGYILFHDSLEVSHHSTVDKSSYKSEPVDREQCVNHKASLTLSYSSCRTQKAVEFTWMMSSLLSNSDTNTFVPSDTRVSDTNSRPLASRWASSGRSRFRKFRTIFSRLKEGCTAPRVPFRASRDISSKFSQHLASKWNFL